MSIPAPDAIRPEPEPIGLPPAKRGRARRAVWLLALLCVPIVAASLAFTVFRLRALQRLQRALAVAELTDPGWDDPAVLTAERPPPAAAEDMTPVLQRLVGRLAPLYAPVVPGPLRTAFALRRTEIQQAERNRRFGEPLPHDLARRVLRDLEPFQPVLDEARALPGRPRATVTPVAPLWPILRPPNSPAQVAAAQVRDLLTTDAAAQAQAGSPDLAVRDAIALLHLGRVHTERPTLSWADLRLRHQWDALNGLIHTLSQATPSEAALASLAAALNRERGEDVVKPTLRAARLEEDRVLKLLAEGRLTLTQAMGVLVRPPRGLSLIPRAVYEHNRAVSLEMFNAAVAIASDPPTEQVRGWLLWQMSYIGSRWPFPVPTMAATGSILSLAEMSLRLNVQLDVMRVAVAAERFRLANGRWPAAPDELVPRYLPAMPIDPFDGQPLHTRPDGSDFRIYSLGRDGRDDGGQVAHTPAASVYDAGMDWGVRLLSPERRGLPRGATPLPPSVFARESRP